MKVMNITNHDIRINTNMTHRGNSTLLKPNEIGEFIIEEENKKWDLNELKNLKLLNYIKEVE